ncbi:MAG: hypothetical protein WCJ07_11730 [Verrucomicrobiota bacterium]
MNDTTRTFLDEGLAVYAKAKDTVIHFEVEMSIVLKGALERKGKLPFLKYQKIPNPEDGGVAADGNWIAIDFIECISLRDERVCIDCGIWWNAPIGKDPLGVSPIIYASFTGEPQRILDFRWENGTGGINSFSYCNRTILYLPVSKSTDIDNHLNRLLDELLKQLE